MIASLNIVAKTFAKIAKTFAGLSATIIATRRRPILIFHLEAKYAKMDGKNEIYAKNWVRSTWTVKSQLWQKSQQSTWSKSTGWRQQADRWWHQQMMWHWRKQVTSARADVVGMTSADNPVARGVRETRGSTSPKILVARESTWTVWWSRFFSVDADRRKTILMVSAATRSKIP